ncbi:MAG: hypothetical protein J6R29_06420 [Clostridia bacterium]|nr:hypothetical protein [Clostridia bacterium]
MKKIKFYLLADGFFIFFALFFVFYAIIKYNGATFTLSLILSSLISVLLTCAFLFFTIIKNDKITSIYKEKELKKALSNYLAFLDKEEVLNLFLNYYLAIKTDAKIESDKIILPKLKTYVFPIFTVEKITTKEVINAYKQTKKGYKAKILYNEATSEVLSFCLDLELRIELFDINSVYFALKNQNLLPELKIKEKSKIKILPLFKNLFKKQKAGKFLLFGIFLLLFSTITFFPLYYIIVGSALIIISIILKFFAPFESEKSTKL